MAKKTWQYTPKRKASLMNARKHLTQQLIPLGKKAFARGERIRHQ